MNTLLRTVRSFFLIGSFLFCCVLLGWYNAGWCNEVSKKSALLPPQLLDQYGLQRIWYNQLQITPKTTKIEQITLEGKTLFVLTSDAKLHAIDTQTGQLIWSRILSDRTTSIFLKPAANSRMVSVVIGNDLFILNRKNGKLLVKTDVPGVVSASNEISEHYVYVPLMENRLVVFPLREISVESSTKKTNSGNSSESTEQQGAASSDNLDDAAYLASLVNRFEKAKKSIYPEKIAEQTDEEIVLLPPIDLPMITPTFGYVASKPILSSEVFQYSPRNKVEKHHELITWSTQDGKLVAAGIEAMSEDAIDLHYAIDSSSHSYFFDASHIAEREWTKGKELTNSPTRNQSVPSVIFPETACEIPSLVIQGSKGGSIFAVKDRTGEVFWQRSTSRGIDEPIAIVGKNVYVSFIGGGMEALDILTGKEVWAAPNVKRFVAASRKRVYALDLQSRLLILDRETGQRLNRIEFPGIDLFLFNIETDRLFLVSESGLIQCLAERTQGIDSASFGYSSSPKEISHRLSRAEYVDALRNKTAPKLYWMSDSNEEDTTDPAASKPASADDENPF
ncbi:MAG: PQQ-binding-like beta-propeller repeat protein [Thermoguttaceae bacterium]